MVDCLIMLFFLHSTHFQSDSYLFNCKRFMIYFIELFPILLIDKESVIGSNLAYACIKLCVINHTFVFLYSLHPFQSDDKHTVGTRKQRI